MRCTAEPITSGLQCDIRLQANNMINDLRSVNVAAVGGGDSPLAQRARASVIHGAPLAFPNLRAANLEIQKLTRDNARLQKRCFAVERHPLQVRHVIYVLVGMAILAT